MSGLLREPLSTEQMDLLRVIFDPFDSTGDWPFWQFVEMAQDRRGFDDVVGMLASLPIAGDPVLCRRAMAWSGVRIRTGRRSQIP
jgi:hypothetical protein